MLFTGIYRYILYMYIILCSYHICTFHMHNVHVHVNEHCSCTFCIFEFRDKLMEICFLGVNLIHVHVLVLYIYIHVCVYMHICIWYDYIFIIFNFRGQNQEILQTLKGPKVMKMVVVLRDLVVAAHGLNHLVLEGSLLLLHGPQHSLVKMASCFQILYCETGNNKISQSL